LLSLAAVIPVGGRGKWRIASKISHRAPRNRFSRSDDEAVIETAAE
jgi:hypothetical protein